jgi:hypothetical protein
MISWGSSDGLGRVGNWIPSDFGDHRDEQELLSVSVRKV